MLLNLFKDSGREIRVRIPCKWKNFVRVKHDGIIP
jgi:hypothetical protein